ncbi:SF1B family DNA helicase RecD2 [Merdimonas faecis]|uniref:ATP-dependent RecD2 DNA helicase n=1 Tax=Merdimonas faecis TaxID=1653435 RepID=A0A9D2VYR0_9FIRM|nr:ATP-dependent RecD-like DNA helicase [Merdimonas faecis]HJH50245.1 ATP-dependent RecD-like DNA helicase [Merdimonas faecis]
MRCRFQKKIFLNEGSGYTVALFTTQDTSVPLAARDKYLQTRKIIGFTAVGFDLPLTDQIEVEMEGKWENTSYGMQLQVENFMEVVPRTREGIIGYLSCGVVKGVGPKVAEAIYREFGLQTLEIMENHPEELLKIRGISRKKLETIVESFGKNKVFRELMTFLVPYKVTPHKVNLILQKFHDESVEVIRKRPYMLCAVKGFGFLTVDEIGRQLCQRLNDPMRISGCLAYIMESAMKEEGHLFLYREELVRRSLELLNDNVYGQQVTETEVQQILYRLVMQGSIVLDEDRVYVARLYEEETQTAAMIARRLLDPVQELDIEEKLKEAQRVLSLTLSSQQEQAVRMVFQHRISIITGGPGTGKTTVLKVILYIHDQICRTKVQLMAPTGRAARRMAESTGYEEASTIHMALGLLGESSNFQPDWDYLSADFLNLDEVSMVDMHLGYEFFRRVKPEARILLVGDVDQLPSVGAGDVFRQLISCGLIPVTRLEAVFRQGASSSIYLNAKKMQENRTDFQFGEDFYFISCATAEETAETVRHLYQKEIGRYGLDGVQILTPYKNKTVNGSKALNQSVEDLVNPPDTGKKEVTAGSQTFREGDKVMQNKNTLMASNGDLGTIQAFYTNPEGTVITVVAFPDGRTVEYEPEQMEMIEHANAITIHKAQGSECEVVIIPWLFAFRVMLKRNILYTGITRAKKTVYLVGDWRAVCQAVHNDDSGRRNTILGERIVRFYQQYLREQEPEQLKLAV